jgi:hypothetical protein
LPLDTAGYIDTVEHLFVLLRRRGLVISPLDADTVRKWQDCGVPLRAVCRAIARGVEKFRHGNRGRAPRSLKYFEKQVALEARAVRRATAGAHAPQPAAPFPASIAAAIAAELSLVADAEGHPALRSAYEAALCRIRALEEREAQGEDVSPALAGIDSDMVSAVLDALAPADRTAVVSEVAAMLGPEAASLGVKAMADRRDFHLGQVLGERYGLARIHW